MAYQIRVKCNCGRVLKIPAKYAGKKGRCPNCSKKISIPSVEEVENKLQTQKEPKLEPERTCPTCGAYLESGVGICPSCNLNLNTGEFDMEGHIGKVSSP